MLSDNEMKELYMARANCAESYAVDSIGRKRFDATATYIMEYLIMKGWTPSSTVEHRETGEVVLYKLKGDEITLKDEGIEIRFDDGNWKWFSMGSFMRHLKLYRRLKLKLDFLFKFYDGNKDEW